MPNSSGRGMFFRVWYCFDFLPQLSKKALIKPFSVDLFGKKTLNNPKIPDFGSDESILPSLVLWKCEELQQVAIQYIQGY